MTAPNAASGQTITVPVETGEELAIEVLEHDPERACIVDPRVATHRFVTGVCPPHALCLQHTEQASASLKILRDMGDLPADWRCETHRVSWTARPSEFRIAPIGAPE